MQQEKKRLEEGCLNIMNYYELESAAIVERARSISKLFKDKYECEELRSKADNKEILKYFDGGYKGRGLEVFLKERAWVFDKAGNTKVYLVKEKGTGNIKAYFSIKCGMLFSPYLYEKMEEDDRQFLELVLEAKRDGDEELLAEYKASGVYTDEKIQKIFNEAQRIIDSDNSGEKDNSFKVLETYSAIELENICKNYSCLNDNNSEKIPFGFLVFWIYVIPIVEGVANKIGCRYIYIYAADQSEKKEQASLIAHYRTNFGFHDAEDLRFIRPHYDENCYGMVQSLKEVAENRDKIWEQFADVIEKVEDIECLIP